MRTQLRPDSDSERCSIRVTRCTPGRSAPGTEAPWAWTGSDHGTRTASGPAQPGPGAAASKHEQRRRPSESELDCRHAAQAQAQAQAHTYCFIIMTIIKAGRLRWGWAP
jgi:hypothetical protein